ncbi:MAG TPA: hypothetical protein VF718_13065 [Allosphingosinicella sp.]|jgi:hypothetical protein
MPLYGAYGLVLDCARPLPLAAAADGAGPRVEIAVALGRPATAPVPVRQRELNRDGADWSLEFREPDGAWLDYVYSAGPRALTVTGSVDWDEAVPPLLGVVCAVLLASAGTPLLHGAAMAFDGEAIGILGASGQGKSTLAAGLLKGGGRLLSEDLLVISKRGEEFEVEPGYARISLLPDSHEALGYAGGAPRPRRGTGKSWIEAAASAEPVPIRRLYILAPPDPAAPDGRARLLPRFAAAAALVRQLYGVSWIRPAGETDLALCGRLAARVPTFTLSRPVSLARVETCAAMLAGGSRCGGQAGATGSG